jgi:hypothetical protein
MTFADDLAAELTARNLLTKSRTIPHQAITLMMQIIKSYG